jgi:hypothetical protein
VLLPPPLPPPPLLTTMMMVAVVSRARSCGSHDRVGDLRQARELTAVWSSSTDCLVAGPFQKPPRAARSRTAPPARSIGADGPLIARHEIGTESAGSCRRANRAPASTRAASGRMLIIIMLAGDGCRRAHFA